MSSNVQLDPTWLEQVGGEFDQPYMKSLKAFLREEKRAGKVIFPAGNHIFNALNTTPFDQVKVVILGQDPYHGPGQAHGLCFSVLPGVPTPPSLQNIFKEIHQDLGVPVSPHGYLQSWAEQGVLLLNATLTVEQGRAGSHQNKGWETFTDAVIAALNGRQNIVFLLWGSYAQRKGSIIDANRHYVLKGPHPSPLSAHRGFFGGHHFSSTNRYLESLGIAPIDWSLPSL
ncbi:uracil-DNA glycosylase [Teredinibacter turnerae]|uniref:uracil-DNA glycosylase n=1 Tax=Teredinibacter turnerae TaxID=2426 RepID=UPI00037C1AD5|nr:uracil-DNA glycosylase [Teredinibacter turnerae]